MSPRRALSDGGMRSPGGIVGAQAREGRYVGRRLAEGDGRHLTERQQLRLTAARERRHAIGIVAVELGSVAHGAERQEAEPDERRAHVALGAGPDELRLQYGLHAGRGEELPHNAVSAVLGIVSLPTRMLRAVPQLARLHYIVLVQRPPAGAALRLR